jgi:hypothetical protein
LLRIDHLPASKAITLDEQAARGRDAPDQLDCLQDGSREG